MPRTLRKTLFGRLFSTISAKGVTMAILGVSRRATGREWGGQFWAQKPWVAAQRGYPAQSVSSMRGPGRAVRATHRPKSGYRDLVSDKSRDFSRRDGPVGSKVPVPALRTRVTTSGTRASGSGCPKPDRVLSRASRAGSWRWPSTGSRVCWLPISSAPDSRPRSCRW